MCQGILHKRNKDAFDSILTGFKELGYCVKYKLVNAKDYSVPQDRERVFIIGFLNDVDFQFPEVHNKYITLKDAIYDFKREC